MVLVDGDEERRPSAGLPTNVAVVAYRRPDHLRRCLEALSRNAEAPSTRLTVFVDGPRSDSEEIVINHVASVAKSFTTFGELHVIRRDHNLGLSRSVTDAVAASLRDSDTVIVLEDDLIVSPYFLRYMNEAIQLYKEDARVASIHGYVYPVDEELPETFFLRGADCLGWATWRSAWSHFEADGRVLLNRLEMLPEQSRELFEFNSSYPYLRMLRSQIEGQNDSWAIRWYASAFLAERFTLYPGRSLVFHAGSDGSGTNVGTTDVFDVDMTQKPVNVKLLAIEEDRGARYAFEAYFRRTRASSSSNQSPKNVAGILANQLRRRIQRFRRGSALTLTNRMAQTRE